MCVYYTVISSAGGLNIIDYITEAVGRCECKLRPQLAPGPVMPVLKSFFRHL